jgi:hypothetical protein
MGKGVASKVHAVPEFPIRRERREISSLKACDGAEVSLRRPTFRRSEKEEKIGLLRSK